MKLEVLKQNLEEKEERLAELENKVKDMTLTDDEKVEVRGIIDEIDQIKEDIKLAEDVQRSLLARTKAKAKAKAEPKKTPEKKVQERFSLFRAIDMKVNGKPLDGVEGEMHQEAQKEAKEAGVSLRGIGIPTVIQRAETAGTAATAGNLISTDLMEFMPALYPKLMLQELGATVMSGLRGDIDIPIGDGLAAATFTTEAGTATETTPSTRKISLSPKRLAAFIDVTAQLLAQGRNVENWVMGELYRAEARKVEDVGIEGGATNEPSGILANTRLGASNNTIAIGTNGGALTRTLILDMIKAIKDDNAHEGSFHFLSTNGVEKELKLLAMDAGSGRFVLEDGDLEGYNFHTSNLVPTDLDKGTSTGVCNAIIFGNFQRLILANWGVRDLIVNPYTKAKQGTIELVLNSFWDANLTHDEAFSVIKDVVLS